MTVASAERPPPSREIRTRSANSSGSVQTKIAHSSEPYSTTTASCKFTGEFFGPKGATRTGILAAGSLGKNLANCSVQFFSSVINAIVVVGPAARTKSVPEPPRCQGEKTPGGGEGRNVPSRELHAKRQRCSWKSELQPKQKKRVKNFPSSGEQTNVSR